MCQDEKYSEISHMFEDVCKENDLWIFGNVKKGSFPLCNSITLSKFMIELELAKESFLLQSEK